MRRPTTKREQSSPPGRLAVRVGKRLLVLPHDQISRITACNMRCEIHLRDGSLTVSRLFKDLLADLPEDQFLRISRSEAVHCSAVIEFRPKSHGDGIVVLRDGTKLVVSRLRRREVLAVLTRNMVGV